MKDLVGQIAACVARGKVIESSPYPPELRGQPGVRELVREALEAGIAPDDIVSGGLANGISLVLTRFKANEVFMPDILMAAKALTAGTDQLEHLFLSGELKSKGAFIIGTVYSSSVSPNSSRFAFGSERSPLDKGEKDLLSMVMNEVADLGSDVSYESLLAAVQGSSCAVKDEEDHRKGMLLKIMRGLGYGCVDLGGNVTSERLTEAVNQYPGAIVGLNAIIVVSPRRH